MNIHIAILSSNAMLHTEIKYLKQREALHSRFLVKSLDRHGMLSAKNWLSTLLNEYHS